MSVSPAIYYPLRRRLLAGEQAAPCWGSAGLWFTLRLTVSMAGFYLIFGPDRSLPRLSVALLTFIAARVLLIPRLRSAPATSRHTP